MFIFLLSLIVIAIAFVGGFYAGVKNSDSKKIEKAVKVFNEIKD